MKQPEPESFYYIIVNFNSVSFATQILFFFFDSGHPVLYSWRTCPVNR